MRAPALVLLCAGALAGAPAAQGSVQSERKISETAGGFGGVLDSNDQFGRCVVSLGDLDGDGIGDLAVGVPGDDDGSLNMGAVWILFMSADGTVASEQKISQTAGGFGGFVYVNDHFGNALAALGDIDGDGIGDLAVGASRNGDGGTTQGSVWILFLNADGTVASEQKISETTGGFGGVLDPGDQFGHSLAGLGDVDGDGIGDLAVGAWGDDDGGTDQGAVWILFLNADGTVASEQKISDTEGDFTGVLDPYDYFGASIVLLGDLDGFGNPELAIGAPYDDDGSIDAGAVWIVSLWFDGTVFNAHKLSETQGAFAHNLDMSDYFGYSVAAPGDVNGDGIPDLAVGAVYDDDGGGNQGAVWMLLLAWNGSVQSVVKISETSGGFGGVLDANDSFGTSVAGLGDLDGDGVGDLAVGAILDDDGGSEQGAVWILFLEGRDEMPPVITCPADMDVEATGSAGAIVAYSVTVSDDRDPMPSLECAPPSGSLFPFGPTTVTCTATDATGNTTISAFIVTVADTTPPVPACPADLILEGTGTSGEVVAYSPTASDLCDPSPSVVSVPPSGSTFMLGTTTVTTTATDAAGNSAQCTFDVVVEDTTPPTLACPTVVSVLDAKGGPAGDFAFFSVTSDDVCDPAPTVLCVPPSGSFFPRGVTMVTCTATDASGNQTLGTFPVIVLPSIRAGSL